MSFDGRKNLPDGVMGLNASGVITNPALLGTGINATQIGNGDVSNTQLSYSNSLTANIQTQINALLAGKSFRGGYNASTNLFPATGGSGTAGAIQAGDQWEITVTGTLGGITVDPGTIITALINSPGQTSGNWSINLNGLSNVLVSANIFVGNSSNLAIGVPMSSQATIDNTGAVTISNAAVIGKLLTGFSSGAGTVSATDSILQAIQKIVGNTTLLTPGIIHQSANYQFLAANTTVIMDSDAKMGTLPAANAAGVTPGVTYTLKLGTGASTGTLAVPTGGTLDGVLNGTFPLTGAYNAVSAQSDGTSWYLV